MAYTRVIITLGAVHKLLHFFVEENWNFHKNGVEKIIIKTEIKPGKKSDTVVWQCFNYCTGFISLIMILSRLNKFKVKC